MSKFSQELRLMFMLRSNRLNIIRYFSYQCFLLFVLIAAISLLFLLAHFLPSQFVRPILLPIIAVLSLIMILYDAYWTVLRLHDYGFSGYWLLTILICVAIPTIAFASFGFNNAQNISLLISKGILLFIGIIPGAKIPNKYGNVPEENNFFNYIFFGLFIFLTIGMIGNQIDPIKVTSKPESESTAT